MSDLFRDLPAGAQADLYTRTIRNRQARFQDSQFDGTANSVNRAATLRLISGGRMSAASSTKPGGEAGLLTAASSTVAYGTPVNYDFPGNAPLADLPLSDDGAAPELAQLVEQSADLAQTLMDYDSRIMVFSSVERTEAEVALRNSNGFAGSYRKTIWSASLGGNLVVGDDFLWLGDARLGSGPDLDFAALKRDVIQVFDWSKTTVPFSAGSYPVIFSPEQMGFLMTPFLACLNGKAFLRGISPWKEKMGEQLLDPRFTLVDDGTLAFTPTSAPFDREGVPTRRNVLIDKGVASQLVLDLQTAKELGRESTGNGTGAGPSAHRAIVIPGPKHSDELIRSIDRGLIVFGSMGAWTGNPYSGVVSGTISVGLLIEHGAIVGRVKNCMFTVNVFEAFKNSLIGISSDARDMGGDMGQPGASFPYVALNDVVIATK